MTTGRVQEICIGRVRWETRGALAAAGFAAALSTGLASAASTGIQGFSFDGFGTLGVVHSSERRADFIGSVAQPNGAGRTHPWSADVDSRAGIQLKVDINEQLAAAGQAVAEHRYDNTYKPDVEWANLKYRFTPDFDVRIGRTVDNLYLQSDLRLVGYAYPWVRRPREIYGLIPVNNKDGIDATYRSYVEDATNTVQVSYGRNEFKLAQDMGALVPGTRKVTERRIFTVTDSLEYGPTTLRVAFTSLRASLQNPEIDSFLGSLTQFGTTLAATPALQPYGAQAIALSERYRFYNRPYSVFTLGANYDPGTWLVIAEWARTPNSPSVLPPSTAWYVAAGYRTGKFTPYAMVARLRAHAPPSEPGIPIAGLPANVAPTAEAFNSGLNQVIQGFIFSQKTVTAGVRWDFLKNAALKLQYDRLKTGSGSRGLLGNVQTNYQPGTPINVVSATVDFVF